MGPLLWVRGIRTLLSRPPFLWLLIISWLRSRVGEECALVCGFPYTVILIN